MDLSLEEEPHLEYWNNWNPLPCQTNSCGTIGNLGTRIAYNPTNLRLKSLVSEIKKHGNWIPPVHISQKIRFLSQKKVVKKNKETEAEAKNTDNSISKKSVELHSKIPNDGPKWRKVLNADWGEQVQLHDVSNYKDGDVIWGMVSLGFFNNIKLYINEYGNICGSADGTISKLGSSEMTFISITNCNLLRKMLNLSTSQWSSLCEAVKQTRNCLKFEALSTCNLNNQTSLEKLWYFVSKRRHYYGEQSMLVKISGAVKCLKKFQITTKLCVVDIRNSVGEPVP